MQELPTLLGTSQRNRRLGGRTGQDPMPRYFFHYRDGHKTAEDIEGTELPNEAASVIEAMISAKEIIAEA
jgi:hypothetical protein